MIGDLKYALRQFLKAPGFTATALLTLALCLGATLTIFAVIQSVLLRPLPFPEPDRLVTIYNTYPKANVLRGGSSIANYYERRGRIEAFESLSMFRASTETVGDTGATEREHILRVSPEFFRTVGVSPMIGRAFADEEMAQGKAHVAILTHDYWHQRYNADPAVLGRELRVNQIPRKIVGVLPPEFRFLSSQATVFLPLSSPESRRQSSQRHSGGGDLVARLKPGSTLSRAQSEIDASNASLERNNPDAKMIADAGFRSVVVPLHEDHVRSARPVLALLGAGVLCLLAIGAVNLVNLLLIRASARSKEIAVRQSMGASRWHVVRQVVAETMLLTLAGSALGLIAAAWGIPLLNVFGADQLPLGAQISLDAKLVLGAVAGAIILGALLALPVSWLSLRSDLARALQSEGRSGTASAGAQRLRHGFIVAQIALAFVLLTGAGLLGMSLKRALAVQPGFRPDHALAGQITTLPFATYPDSAARVAFSERLREAAMRQPGVTALGVITNVPLSDKTIKSAITVLGHVLPAGESLRAHYSYGVTGDYFAAMGIPLREGRFLDTSDSQRSERSCVVDEDFARRYFPQGGAIGQRVFHGGGDVKTEEAFTIVGVVGAVKQAELTDRDAVGAVYFPLLHHTDYETYVVARTSIPAETFAGTLQKIVRGIDPDVVVADVRAMEVRIADSLSTRRSPALLAGVFGGIALLLAAIGTYGVLSYAVAQRRREIGVRMALGAQREQIARHFLSLGVRLLIGGTLVGLLAAMAAGRAMQSLLFDVPPLHLATFAGAAAVMAVVSVCACLLPARRAASVNPMVALRSD